MKNKERGSALVLVIFAMTMIILLTLTLSASLLSNYKMKKSELTTERNIYVNDSCESYTQALLSNMINDSLISALNDAFTNTVRTELQTTDEYTDNVLDAAKDAYKTRILSKSSTFLTDLQHSMDTITAHYVTTNQSLKSITCTIDSANFNNGKCTISYRVNIENNSNVFTMKYDWDAYTIIDNVCREIISSENGSTIDPTKINVTINTIYG